MSKKEMELLEAIKKNGHLNDINQATDIQALNVEFEWNQDFMKRANQAPKFDCERTVTHREWKRKAYIDAQKRNTLIKIRLKELGS